MEALISTGAIIGRPNGRDHRLLLPLSKEIGADGYEFMMYSNWYENIDTICEDVKSYGVRFPVLHCQKAIGEDITKGEEKEAFRRFAIDAHTASVIGADRMVLHLWNGEVSDFNFPANLRAYSELRRIADGEGIELLIENVVCSKEDPLKHWCELVDAYGDVKFVFDTKMAAFHGQLELLYSEDYAWLWREGHIRHYHVNDYAGGYKDWAALRTLPIGKGNLDIAGFLKFVRSTGYDGTFTLEGTAFDKTGVVDVALLNEELAAVRKMYSE